MQRKRFTYEETFYLMRKERASLLLQSARGGAHPRFTCLGKGSDFAFLATLQRQRLALSTCGFRLSSFTGGTGFQPVIHMYRQDACTPSACGKNRWTVSRSSRRSLKATVAPRPPVNPKPDFSVPSNLCGYTTPLSPNAEISTARESDAPLVTPNSSLLPPPYSLSPIAR